MRAFLAALLLTLPAVAADAQGNGRNAQPGFCPPGLAKKDPPCVPPGLARQGVTAEEWQDRAGRDSAGDETTGRLSSAEIADLYGLDPAPDGSRYALVNGVPVLLSAEEAAILAEIEAQTRIVDGVSANPVRVYGPGDFGDLLDLPPAPAGQRYTVIDGEVVLIDEDTAGLLDLLLLLGVF